MVEKIINKYLITCSKNKYSKSTFNGYSKSKVFSELKKNIIRGDINNAILWAIELDISGFTKQLWEKCIILSIKEIGICNPYLHNYLIKRYFEFIRIYKNYENNPINIINNQESRNLLIELIILLIESQKKKLIELPKITN